MSYADLATALDVTVPAVKSLLVRARLGLVEAADARSTDCAVIREDLASAYDRGVKASGRARRHMRECSGCNEYRKALRNVRSSFAALSPGVGGAAALIAKLFGGGAAAGGAAAGGGGALAGGGVAVGGATACKVAAVACAAALTAGGAVEVKQIADHRRAPAVRSAESAAATASRPSPSARQAALTSAAAAAPAPIAAPVRRSAGPGATRERHPAAAKDEVLAPPSIPIYEPTDLGGATAPEETPPVTGGVTAPDEPAVSEPPIDPEGVTPVAPTATDPVPVQTDTQAGKPAPTIPAGQPTAEPAVGEGTSAPAPGSGGARSR